MIKNKYTVFEIALVVLLVLFIVFVFLFRPTPSEKSIDEIAAPVLEVMDTSAMTKKTAADAAKTFGFDTEKEEGIVYFNNDNIMDCSELLIIKLKNPDDASAFKKLIEKRVENQMNLFKNYAPEQYSLLSQSIVEIRSNTVFYCTATNADAVFEAYKKAL